MSNFCLLLEQIIQKEIPNTTVYPFGTDHRPTQYIKAINKTIVALMTMINVFNFS